jgi:flagellar biosynthesis protein FlhF
MQVKKFEARTMKEALEMVKTQLGPDAIILSARDNNKSFGLVGEGSVEITAAVSDETLQKKKFAESRLREQDKEKFLRSPARQQKDFIAKVVDKQIKKNQLPPPITKRRYIDIEEDERHYSNSGSPQAHQQSKYPEQRLGASAQRAINAFQQQDKRNQVPAAPIQKIPVSLPPRVLNPSGGPERIDRGNPSQMESEVVKTLKNEIESLKLMINKFQQMPQNFLGAHPGSDFGITYEMSFLYKKLVDAGMAPEITAEILIKAQETLPVLKLKNKPLVEAWVARYVLDYTKIVSEPNGGKIHCFVGPAGSGKTSILIKMASNLVVREKKKVALITTDTYKVGAADQMKIYSQILNVPFSIIRHQNDWMQISKYLGNVDCVLVDCAGLGMRNSEEVYMMKNLLPPASMDPSIHLVLSANSKDSDITELGRRYSALNYKDAIFTGIDESTQHGAIYNFIQRFDIPLHSFGIGTRVPEDFEYATKERLLDLIFKITRVSQQDLQNL